MVEKIRAPYDTIYLLARSNGFPRRQRLCGLFLYFFLSWRKKKSVVLFLFFSEMLLLKCETGKKLRVKKTVNKFTFFAFSRLLNFRAFFRVVFLQVILPYYFSKAHFLQKKLLWDSYFSVKGSNSQVYMSTLSDHRTHEVVSNLDIT